MGSFYIADLKLGEPDMLGHVVEEIHGKVSGRYAVYTTSEGVKIQFADDDSAGAQQRASLAPLLPARSTIGLEVGRRRLEAGDKPDFLARQYEKGLAVGLLRALQGDVSAAETDLNSILADITTQRGTKVRTEHLFWSLVGLGGALLLALLLVGLDRQLRPYGNAVGFGAFGALFSIALQLRDRQINIDLTRLDNLSDALLRIFIGSASAVLLTLLLKGGYADLSIGSAALHNAEEGLMLVAFLAGFTERMVSNYLSGLGESALAATASPNAKPAGSERSVSGEEQSPREPAATEAGPAPQTEFTEQDEQEPAESETDEGRNPPAARQSQVPMG